MLCLLPLFALLLTNQNGEIFSCILIWLKNMLVHQVSENTLLFRQTFCFVRLSVYARSDGVRGGDCGLAFPCPYLFFLFNPWGSIA